MLEVNRILKVPARVETRRNLRESVRAFLAGKNVLPPASLETLTEFAEELSGKAGTDNNFPDFTIVLLGNEIWRDTVASIPYNRRLLLLPQCLRNKNGCQGIFDDLGLICAGCNGCNLNNIISKAESLGYTTLVAEGTTVAVGLVEEGAIDAVIGVSCMPVLHRSFDPVTKAAVPGIGIPLLENGCENTTVDYEWLEEEIENYKPDNRLMPLSVSLLRNVISDYFKSPVISEFFDSGNSIEQLAKSVMSRGGQRIRPLLATLAYQAYSPNPSDNAQKYLSIAIECFHKASLLHDDIEDDEESRYGYPSLHKEMGIPVAINMGDYLVGKGYSLLSKMAVDQSILAECFSVVAESHVKLAEGQGEDIMLSENLHMRSVEDVINIFSLKTGEAIKVSLLAGAVAGKAPEQDKKSLASFSRWFGIAYQIRDDLNEFRGDNGRAGIFDYPFLVALLQERKDMLKTDFGKDGIHDDIDLLVRDVKQTGIEGKAEEYFRDYVSRCYAELDNLENMKMRLALYRLLGKVFKDYSNE
jgi:geranylgeranyl diphosphate synthase, type II